MINYKDEMAAILAARQKLQQDQAQWSWEVSHGSMNLQQLAPPYGGNTGIDRYLADKQAGFSNRGKILDIREQAAQDKEQARQIKLVATNVSAHQARVKRQAQKDRARGGHPQSGLGVSTTRPAPRRHKSGARAKFAPKQRPQTRRRYGGRR